MKALPISKEKALATRLHETIKVKIIIFSIEKTNRSPQKQMQVWYFSYKQKVTSIDQSTRPN